MNKREFKNCVFAGHKFNKFTPDYNESGRCIATFERHCQSCCADTARNIQRTDPNSAQVLSAAVDSFGDASGLSGYNKSKLAGIKSVLINS